MKQIVIMPGGFHPFHAGHANLYQQAKEAFPSADIYVAATNDQSERPFPFSVKEKLAKVAGVEPGHFIQVKSPFQAKEITQNYNPDEDVLIFVRSEKDRNESPKPGGMKKDGTPAYFQPWTGKNVQPFSKHAYITYLKTVEFGPGITSATEIRNAWPTLNDKRKTAMVMSLYPASQKNPKLAANIVGMLDQVMGGQEGVTEGSEQINEYRDRLLQYVKSLLPTWPEYVLKDWLVPNKGDFSNLPDTELKNGIMEKLKGAGLTPNSKWQLVPNMKFTMDMFDPKTKQLLIGRAGGSSDLGMGIPKDKERHTTQAALAQQQGGVRKEPVLLIKSANGYELLEGWHRTIQHFVKYPDGYTGPAYVAVAQGQQGVAEDKESDPVTSAVLSFYKPVVNDIHKEKLPDYVDQARDLLHQTNDPEVRSKLIDIFKKGKENPYIQGGIVTTVGALLAGGILTTAQRMGLSPAQTNLALQAILNTVIPTVVSRINGKNWSDTIKYTLASAGIGTGIAGAGLLEDDLEEGFGIPLPGTYEQEHDMDQKQSGHHTRNLTTETNMSESMDYIEEK